MIDEEWIFLVLCVHFKVFNNGESFLTATSELLFFYKTLKIGIFLG